MSREVVQGRESFKRFIKTILDHLPAFIKKYPPSDQLLLTDFLSVLQYYEEADYQRKKLLQRFEEYNKRLFGTEQYLHTAFLWFVSSYFLNAKQLLYVSHFHANLFYEYLVKHLRGNSTIPGVYSLVRGNIPLSDPAWERLQYECHKLLIPLTNDQLQILKIVYSYIAEEGVYTLDHRQIKDVIFNRVEFPKKIKPFEELTRFFTLIDGRWFCHFFSPAFGLERLFFHIQLQESTSIEDIIDFHNPTNTVLCISDVYSARDLPNTYIGILLIPKQEIDQLESYLQHCENQGYLILKELIRITTTSTSASLNHYRANTGWFELNPTKMRRLTSAIKSKHPKKRQMESFSLFISRSFNHHWYYNQHPLPTKIIKLYCKIPHEYSYSSLPLRPSDQDSTALSRTEIGLLKQLYYNEVIRIGFVPWRLVYEFSLDLYYIIIPKIPIFQLKRFLNLLPYCDIYYTEKSISILARLTPKLVHWIENDLNWTVISIIRTHYRHNLNFNWFDSGKLQWKTPIVLTA